MTEAYRDNRKEPSARHKKYGINEIVCGGGEYREMMFREGQFVQESIKESATERADVKNKVDAILKQYKW